MASLRFGPLRRPRAMAIDRLRCIECGACGDLAPGLMDRSEAVLVTAATLEAMAACPVGAIHWLEGEERHGDRPRDA